MASIAKTIVATGASSGLGFEVVKQLLQQKQPYKFILGVRDTKRTQATYDELQYDTITHSVVILPLELSTLRDINSFASQVLAKVGEEKLEYLLLNAGMAKSALKVGNIQSKWCEAYAVNHLSQHYLLHLLREKLTASCTRVVVVSSGNIRHVRDGDPATLDQDLVAGSGADSWVVYSATKFAQLLGAHYWRRQLKDSCTVIAVSPGLIPLTGITRHSDVKLTSDMPDAKTVPEGARSILAAFTRDDLPADSEQIFLTSWGEWWPKNVYAMSLDTELQNKWCLSKAEIEKEEGLSPV